VKRSDQCPGVLQPHQAADGAVVRIRVPGGQTTGAGLAHLGRLAQQYGSGLLQLTSRASVQIRGLPAELPTRLVDDLAATGFLPSRTHERVRNIVASPLTGLEGGLADLRPIISGLDQALMGDARLADLPGRFLFVLDDGRGDVSSLNFDIGYRATDSRHGMIMVGGPDRGFPEAADAAVRALVRLAREFLSARSRTGAWHVRELQPFADRFPRLPVAVPDITTIGLGRLGPHASVAAPLGFLEPGQILAVARATEGGPVVITPWRGVLLPDCADRLSELQAAGLVVDQNTMWATVTGCVGSRWCAKGRIDTQRLIRSVADRGVAWPRTHVSGCERRCGAPAGPHRDLVAPTQAELLAVAGSIP
jgi:precorrin-3B synthase